MRSHSSLRIAARVVIVVWLAMLAGACGGEDSNDQREAPTPEASSALTASPSASETASETGSETASETASELGSDEPTVGCENDLVATYPDGTQAVLDTSTAAVSLSDGAAYSIYAGDYEIATDGIEITGVEPPEGSRLAAVFITVFNPDEPPPPLEAGTSITWSNEMGVLTFTTILYDGPIDFGQAVDAVGTVDVQAVDEESICIEVDYQDAEKTLRGTLVAPVVGEV